MGATTQHKIELPPEKRLQRVIQAAGNQFTESLFTQMEQALPLATKERLDTLLQDDGTGLTLSKLKADPGHAGLDSVVRESEKLAFLRNLELPENLLKHLHPKLLGKYRQRLATESAWEVRRHPPRIRYAVLAIYCFLRQREITDGLIDLFIQIVHRISVRAERKVVKELLRDFQKVHGKTTLLFRIAEASLDRPQDTVQDVVYPIAGETTLSNLVKEFKSTGVAYTKQVHTLIRSSYSTHYRRMLPKLLEALSFRSNNQQHRPVLDALVWIERHRESKRQYYQLTGSIPIEGVVRPKWRDVVIEKQGAAERINRINYEICVLQALRDKLRCKEIWVVGADRFRNPDEDLPTDFYSKRAFYYQDLGHSENAEEFIAGLQASMRTALSQLNATLPKNKKVRLQTRGKNPISISPLDAQPDPVNIEKLKREIAARWPMTSLLDILGIRI